MICCIWVCTTFESQHTPLIMQETPAKTHFPGKRSRQSQAKGSRTPTQTSHPRDVCTSSSPTEMFNSPRNFCFTLPMQPTNYLSIFCLLFSFSWEIQGMSKESFCSALFQIPHVFHNLCSSIWCYVICCMSYNWSPLGSLQMVLPNLAVISCIFVSGRELGTLLLLYPLVNSLFHVESPIIIVSLLRMTEKNFS